MVEKKISYLFIITHKSSLITAYKSQGDKVVFVRESATYRKSLVLFVLGTRTKQSNFFLFWFVLFQGKMWCPPHLRLWDVMHIFPCNGAKAKCWFCFCTWR